MPQDLEPWMSEPHGFLLKLKEGVQWQVYGFTKASRCEV